MDNERSRAWRRFVSRVKARKTSNARPKTWKPEKNWKMVYTRAEKQIRARQLGFDYPVKSVRQKLDAELPLKDKHSDDEAAVYL